MNPEGCFKFVILLFVLLFPATGSSQETEDQTSLEDTIKEITDYSVLIEQIINEKSQAQGSEALALSKQLLMTQDTYRALLWKFASDLSQSDRKQEFAAEVSASLSEESALIKKEIQSRLAEIADLEKQLTSAKKFYSLAGRTRVTALKSKLSKRQKALEALYSALVKNADSLNALGQDASQDIEYVKPLLKKQADILSGIVGLDNDELAVLEKKLSAVSNESKSGKELLSKIRAQNMLIQTDARRLNKAANLLEKIEVDASLYKKTVVQSGLSFNGGIFDRKVASHLFSQWWLETKKWFNQQAPEILGKTATFLLIIFLAILVAVFIKKMLRRIFRRSFPEMSELAKNFIVSMSSKLLILAGILLALSNIGVQIGPILAGLGIMGFIIGFALQDTLSNFASGLMILIYRPYDIGDKIISAGVKGRVNKMNLVSTTIFTSENHQLTVPNKKIWSDIIQNVTSQPLHRLDLFFSVPYNSDSETVRKAISDVVENCPSVFREKEISVRIQELGEVDVKYLARFWVSTEDIYEAQWAVSEGVKKRFDEEGISLNIAENARH